MRLARVDAMQLLNKWKTESTRVAVALVGPDTVFAARISGFISELTDELLTISEGDSLFTVWLRQDMSFEYADAREALPHAKEWAESSVEGSLFLIPDPDIWRCTLIEPK